MALKKHLVEEGAFVYRCYVRNHECEEEMCVLKEISEGIFVALSASQKIEDGGHIDFFFKNDALNQKNLFHSKLDVLIAKKEYLEKKRDDEFRVIMRLTERINELTKGQDESDS